MDFRDFQVQPNPPLGGVPLEPMSSINGLTDAVVRNGIGPAAYPSDGTELDRQRAYYWVGAPQQVQQPVIPPGGHVTAGAITALPSEMYPPPQVPDAGAARNVLPEHAGISPLIVPSKTLNPQDPALRPQGQPPSGIPVARPRPASKDGELGFGCGLLIYIVVIAGLLLVVFH